MVEGKVKVVLEVLLDMEVIEYPVNLVAVMEEEVAAYPLVMAVMGESQEVVEEREVAPMSVLPHLGMAAEVK